MQSNGYFHATYSVKRTRRWLMRVSLCNQTAGNLYSYFHATYSAGSVSDDPRRDSRQQTSRFHCHFQQIKWHAWNNNTRVAFTDTSSKRSGMEVAVMESGIIGMETAISHSHFQQNRWHGNSRNGSKNKDAR